MKAAILLLLTLNAFAVPTYDVKEAEEKQRIFAEGAKLFCFYHSLQKSNGIKGVEDGYCSSVFYHVYCDRLSYMDKMPILCLDVKKERKRGGKIFILK